MMANYLEVVTVSPYADTSQLWDLGVGISDDSFYYIGGSNGWSPERRGYKYHMPTNTWSQIAKYPVNFAWISAEIVGGTLYGFGGERDSDNGTYMNTSVHKYNDDANSWAQVGNMPVVLRSGIQETVVIDDVIWGYNYGDSYFFNTKTTASGNGTLSTITGGNKAVYHNGLVYFNTIESRDDQYFLILWSYDTKTNAKKLLHEMKHYGKIRPYVKGVYDNKVIFGETDTFNYYDIATQQAQVGPRLEGIYAEGNTTVKWSFKNDGIYFTANNLLHSRPIYRLSYGAIQAVDLAPQSGFINAGNKNTLSWVITTILPEVKQKSANIEWYQVDGSAKGTLSVVGEKGEIIVQAGTFPQGTIKWRVQPVSTNNIAGDWTEYAEFTTRDMIHLAPTGLSPNGIKVNGTRIIQLSWLTRSPLGSPQTAFEVQVNYTGKSSDWESLSGIVKSPSPTYNLEPNELNPKDDGTVFWRVRTYNDDDTPAPSPWSINASMIAVVAPNPPHWVSVERGKSRPLCKWSMRIEPESWQLQVAFGDSIIYDTGEQYGFATEYRIKDYLPNGNLVFKVRIKNEINEWSEYAELETLVNAKPLVKVVLDGESISDGVRLTIIDKEVNS